MDRQFEKLYSQTGRPSIAPERLIRALLLQVLYTIRSERLLVEQLEYNLLFRWFVGVVSEYSDATSLGDEMPQNRPKSPGSRDRYTGPQCHPAFAVSIGSTDVRRLG